MGQGYEILDHTADLSLRAWGADLRELIGQAAAGLLALIYRDEPGAAAERREVTVTADSPELLLQRSLRELLYLMEDEALAPVTVEVASAEGESVHLRVGVKPLEAVRSLLRLEIKAVTRHGLEIRSSATGLEVTLVFDV
jgi:SHS2 domain-containing protein